MIVREMEEKDIADALTLIRAKAEFDGCLDSFKLTHEEIYKVFFSSRPRAKGLVAEFEKRIVGIATYYDIYSTFIAKPGIWLDDLYIYKEYRNNGIGKLLIRKLCSIAAESGCGRIDWIVATNNGNGRSFYESIGAKIYEEVRHARLNENAIKNLARIA